MVKLLATEGRGTVIAMGPRLDQLPPGTVVSLVASFMEPQHGGSLFRGLSPPQDFLISGSTAFTPGTWTDYDILCKESDGILPVWRLGSTVLAGG